MGKPKYTTEIVNIKEVKNNPNKLFTLLVILEIGLKFNFLSPNSNFFVRADNLL